MKRSKLLSLTLITTLSLFFVIIILLSAAQAAAHMAEVSESAALSPADTTTLTVTIRSSPYAPLDHNESDDLSKVRVVVIMADVQNAGPNPASDVALSLDYDDPLTGWVLLDGETPGRSLGSLAPDAHGYAYWFATYPAPSDPGATSTHTYTVTATAANAPTETTSENAYGESLPPGATIQSQVEYLETGSTPTINTDADVGVGSIFTATVIQSLGSNPNGVIFSPVGNLTFDAGTLRLVDVDVVLTGTNGTVDLPNHIYVPDASGLVGGGVMAKVLYSFLPQRPGQITLCPYSAVVSPTPRYDAAFCQGANVVAIDATLNLSFTASVDRSLVQQSERLTYTVSYTNNGTVPVSNAWIWSEVDPAVGTVLTPTMTAVGNTSQSTGSRAVWSLGTIGVDENGTLTFEVQVDGNGADIPDGTDVVVPNFFGIEQGNNLPTTPAVTETLTTTVQAPDLVIAKSDGELGAEPFDPLTYTVQVTNAGSIPAENVVITDVLPVGVTYSGGAGETSQDGSTLLWDDGSSIGAGETISLAIPVTIDGSVPNGTVLTNTATVRYQNDAGYYFDPAFAVDRTVVSAPVLSIYKSAGVNSVLTGRPLTYTLTYSNGGPAPATGVLITDVVPAGTTYSDCAGGSSCSYDGNMVSWTVGTIPAQSEGSVSFTVLVDSGLATGDILVNDDYGLLSDQSGFITGPAVNTTVARDAAIFDGYTFVDTDLDGVYDEGETPLPAVPLTLTAAVVAGDVSDPDGYYAFRVEQEGPVTLSAGLPTGYFRTTVGTVPAYATLGFTQTINFGYAPIEAGAATITGIVFDDANGNGLLDGAEQGIPDVTITLDGTTNTLTDQNGRYTLATSAEGLHTVVETDPAGYTSTTPNSVNVDVVAGQNYQVDFGDMLAGGEATSIFGTVFADNNGDGLQGTDEPGLQGVLITLDGSETTTTNANGGYTFATAPGSHTVVEADPTGFVSTTPNSVNVVVAAGESAQVDFGDVAEGAAFTSIYGTVFDDTNGNGVQDAGEVGIAGVELTLDGGETTTTNPNGGYTFPVVDGDHTVVETDPAGYTSTTPNTVNVAVTTGNNYQVDFGDMVAGGEATSIFGTVFADNNGDGLQDAGEPGLAGVVITLDGSETTTTNANGGYTFATGPGSHTVVETEPTGYRSTTPNSVIVSLAAGESAQVDFGDVAEGAAFTSIYGTVFDDTNGDGVQNAGEVGIAGVELTLDGSDIATTNANGGYTFPVAGGDHTLVESDPAGYVSTTPNTVNVAVASGNTYQVDFGDMAEGGAATTVYGTVFNDIDGDGIQDPGEPGLAGVEISRDGSDTISTNAWGGYSFATIAGNHTITETDPAGFVSTTPNSVNVAVAAGGSAQVDFGDMAEGGAATTIYGTVFDDADADGIQDPAELGLPNVQITLDAAGTATTNAYGGYTFATTDGNHTVVETDPAGYTSTTPNSVNVAVAAGASVQVDFGDLFESAAFASIHGTVFADADGDGLQDSGELGIAGVEITLDGGETTTTNPNGGYSFPAAAGNHFVTETDPAGFRSTTPNSVNVSVLAGESAQVDFGDVAEGAGFASIFGIVFEDSDGDGIQDAGESGLAAVELTLDGAQTATTNPNGIYAFPVATGSHTLVETDPAGYTSTTPNTVNLDVVAGQQYQVDFGDIAGSDAIAVIYGTVFDDANANGVQDAGELGLAGVELTLDDSETTTTNAWGAYSFAATPGEVHKVAEQDPDNYVSTTPNVVYVDVATGGYRVDFGDLSVDSERSAIYGTVFDDVDRSGGRDAGEMGLQGVTVTLGDLTRITDGYGRYTFPIAEAGQYTVVETDLEGFGSSTPNRVSVEVTAGTTAQVDFGDYALCEVDAYEEDDTLAGAGAIALGNGQARNFCDDSVDWVTLDAPAGSRYTFTTDATGDRADTVLTLYATDGQTMLTGNDDSEGTGSFSSTFAWTSPADGTYYLRVRNRAGLYGAGTAYELIVEEEIDDTVYLFLPVIRNAGQPAQLRTPARRFRSEPVAELAARSPAAPSGNIVHSCPDPYEVDDHWTLARTLVPGVLETHSFDSDTTRYAADKDFFRFTLTPYGTFSVDVVPVTGTQTELELYDEHGMMLEVSGSTSLFYDGPAGTYYLSVAPTSPTFGCAGEAGYTLQAELTGSQIFLPVIAREVASE